MVQTRASRQAVDADAISRTVGPLKPDGLDADVSAATARLATGPVRSDGPLRRLYETTVRTYEVPRKLLHVSIGFLVLRLYYIGYDPANVRSILFFAFWPVWAADLLRFTVPRFNALYISAFGFLMRPKEHANWNWNGVIPYMAGVWTVLTFFPRDIAVVAILLLSWSDTAASTIGRLYGKSGPFLRPGKSLIGSLAAVVSGSFAAWLFWGVVAETPNIHLGGRTWTDRLEVEAGFGLVELCVLAGLVAGAAEAIDIWFAGTPP